MYHSITECVTETKLIKQLAISLGAVPLGMVVICIILSILLCLCYSCRKKGGRNEDNNVDQAGIPLLGEDGEVNGNGEENRLDVVHNRGGAIAMDVGNGGDNEHNRDELNEGDGEVGRDGGGDDQNGRVGGGDNVGEVGGRGDGGGQGGEGQHVDV